MKRRPDHALLLALAALGAGCSGDRGDTGPPGGPGPPPTPTTLERGDDPPGIELAIVGLWGGSGPGGAFVAGDRVGVRFTARKDDGTSWDLAELSGGAALVSGPSFNYNRVLPEAADLLSASVRNGDGSYGYTFAARLPKTYAAPYNDSPSFGAIDGELTGQPLLDGTYTVGLRVHWDYDVEGAAAVDAASATRDFVLGSPAGLAPRELVTEASCNRCHVDLTAHGGTTKGVKLCVLCHTSGAEDANAGGTTPGTSIDFRVMVHKIHSGRHLPSVLGVGTLPDGSRDYTRTPEPYVLVGDTVEDYSQVSFPVFPNRRLPLPRDTGYGALTASEQALEDTMRSGVADCGACHGDPDGLGPELAPLQGDLVYAQPTMRACGSCHDDIDWTLPYEANDQTMPPQAVDSLCIYCHPATGDELAVIDGHRHPLLDPAVNPGLVLDVTAVGEGPGSDNSGTVDVGERVRVTLTVQDDAGAGVDPADLASRQLVISGPTGNANLLLSTSIPAELLTAPQPFVFEVPEAVHTEFVGDSDPLTAGEVFATARTPHLDGPTSPTSVWARAPLAGGTTLAAAASRGDNFLDVVDATGIAADDVVVIDDALPASEEYLRVQWVDGDRLWFASPYQSGSRSGLRNDHAGGADVSVADLTLLTDGVDYDLDPVLGTLTETPELGDVAVVVSYTTDFLIPATFGAALNESPDLDETDGKWNGKSVVDGTYTLTIWGHRDVSVDVLGEVTDYRAASRGESRDFLIGSTTGPDPYDLIDSGANCNACHQDLVFHGGTRRGFESCIACHGTAGAEDRPRYVAANAPETSAVQVSFREMLHRIHMGSSLANAATYTVVGYGADPAPENFSTHGWEDVRFPARPGAAAECAKCHGDADAWRSPGDRDHPFEQGAPVRSWAQVCGACHDSPANAQHIADNTASGYESCAVCHGVGKNWDVERMHRSY